MVNARPVRSLARRLAPAVSTVGFGQSAFAALVPLIATRTGLGTGEIGFAVAAGALAFVFGAPLIGGHGTGFSQGSVLRALGLLLLVGQLVLAGLVWAQPLAPLAALWLLAASRVVYGLGASGVMPTAQAWVAREAHDSERQSLLALLSAGLGSGRILGATAAMTASLAAPLPFLLLVLSPITLLLAPGGGERHRQTGGSRRMRPTRGMLPFLAAGFCLTMGFGQVQMILGPYLQARFGVAAVSATAATGLILALVAMVMILVQVMAVPRLPFGRKSNVVFGAGLLAFGAGIAAASGNLVACAAGLVLGGIGVALASPAYLAWLVSRLEPEEQGAGAGWMASAHVLGQGAGALAGGYAFALWPLLPFIACACLASATAIAMLAMRQSAG
ncbi:MFS transporter [Nitratireductor sp. ZSWI3]|uniref:MFS transporter n=1 Tax=Nitratireductor sp. ZSWI3 TaxID=2966359 RepID=UPI00214F92A9|nr:MFS transporter [Nitratireductor sp. ZSWI3]MCR4264865.1 MFS transporter [Nitratireductor sp. ZSWI3]